MTAGSSRTGRWVAGALLFGVVVLIAQLAGTVLLAKSFLTDRPTPPQPCGECAAEITTLEEQIAASPQIREVTRVRYVTARTLTRPPAVEVWFAPEDNLAAAHRAIAELVEARTIRPVREIVFLWDVDDGYTDSVRWVRADPDAGPFALRQWKQPGR